MYLSIPNSFLVPVYYDECILDIEEIVEIVEFQGYINGKSFTTKIVNRNDLVIGVSFSTQRDERWIKEKEAMEAYAMEKNVALKIENAEYDEAKQAEQVENLILQGIDVLILIAVDVNTAGEIVEKTKKAGVKVLIYEALILNTDLDLFVGFNNLKAGEAQGRYLISKVPRGNYIIMYAESPYDISLKEGALQFIKPLVIIGNVNIIAEKAIENWDPNIAYRFMNEFLSSNINRIDAILAPNDAIAGATIKALQEHGLDGKVVITGQDAELDAIRRIIKGTQSMTLFKDVRESARKNIDVAIKLGNGEEVLTDDWIYNGKKHIPAILITPVLVDKNNINDVFIKSGYLKKEDIYNS